MPKILDTHIFFTLRVESHIASRFIRIKFAVRALVRVLKDPIENSIPVVEGRGPEVKARVPLTHRRRCPLPVLC